MTVPLAYTEPQLITFMASILGNTATVLNWTATPGNEYDEAVIATLIEYGVTDIANATDMTKLRALGRFFVWLAVVHSVASYNDSDFFDHAKACLDAAYYDAYKYLKPPRVTVKKVTYNEDPYQPNDYYYYGNYTFSRRRFY